MHMPLQQVLAIDASGREVYLQPLSYAKRESNIIVIDRDTVFYGLIPIYPGYIDYDRERREVVLTWVIKSQKLRIRPLYEIIEANERELYMILKRTDGQLFKVIGMLIPEVILNIHLNPGLTLANLIGIEGMLWSKRIPQLLDKKLEIARDLAREVAEIVGFLAYEAGLVELVEEG